MIHFSFLLCFLLLQYSTGYFYNKITAVPLALQMMSPAKIIDILFKEY